MKTTAPGLRLFAPLLALAFFAGVIVPSVLAQAPTARQSGPRIGYVYPAGGQQGSTFTIVVGGQFLEGVTDASFFGPGISARVTSFQRPTNQKEDNDLKEELEKLQEKRKAAPAGSADKSRPAWTAEDDKRIAEIREMLAYRPNRQTAPAISEAVTLEVSIAPDAAPGKREIRLSSPRGLSNPLQFHVGQLTEFSEPAAHPNTVAPEGRNPENPRPIKSSPERRITLPATVNGQILPGEVDRIRFSATKGQRLVVSASARALIPYLADAVPGWFQATLALLDAKGRELAYDDDFRFNPDPVLLYQIPADGEYVIAIKDAIYRGRQDFVYRIAVGELPCITSIYPLGGQTGRIGTVELRGWNLPSSRVTVDGTREDSGTVLVSVSRDGILSNQVDFALDPQADTGEKEPNNDTAHAQPLAVPSIVNGRISKPGDCDVYRLEGKAGDAVVAEVFARRLASPLDSVLTITDAQGKTIASNDDTDDKGAGLETHHADSRVAFRIPSDGICHIQLSDTQRNGGPEYAYRLHVRTPQPDFALRTAPSTLNLRGDNVPITVYALRRDGFTGPIDIVLTGPDAGLFTLAGARIPAGEDKVRLTLGSPQPKGDRTVSIGLAGRADVGGRRVTRRAIPCEDMMQAFAYRHLVPAQELKVRLIARGQAARAAFVYRAGSPLKIPAGGTTRLELSTPATRNFADLQVELSEPPDGISIAGTHVRDGSVTVTLSADAAKVKAGQKGNLILFATGERKNAGAEKAKNAPRRTPLGTLPALPYEIVAP